MFPNNKKRAQKFERNKRKIMSNNNNANHRPSIRSSTSSSSPSLFENLRSNCLARARENRAQYVAEKRRLVSPSGDLNSSKRMAQQLVQSELRRQNIQVQSPNSPSLNESESELGNSNLNPEGPFIEDHELYQLMQEIEAELEREGRTHVCAYLKMEIVCIELRNSLVTFILYSSKRGGIY